ncbi:hypothetical protein C2G38_2187193 [Gigaspora rosea]|uniref:Uncharacterized protein n=1 Tax=Gigaspora rosea TaxID=44941 RepID=A0A397V4W8_9GLOM|nr:hypothetical protein C2G38_2187193 [Gigaspora rosea]
MPKRRSYPPARGGKKIEPESPTPNNDTNTHPKGLQDNNNNNKNKKKKTERIPARNVRPHTKNNAGNLSKKARSKTPRRFQDSEITTPTMQLYRKEERKLKKKRKKNPSERRRQRRVLSLSRDSERTNNEIARKEEKVYNTPIPGFRNHDTNDAIIPKRRKRDSERTNNEIARKEEKGYNTPIPGFRNHDTNDAIIPKRRKCDSEMSNDEIARKEEKGYNKKKLPKRRWQRRVSPSRFDDFTATMFYSKAIPKDEKKKG